MTLTINEIEDLKEEIGQTKKEKEKALLLIEQSKTSLKEEFGCASLKEAKTLMQKYISEAEEIDAEIEELCIELEEIRNGD